jgi:hypothetical protein
MKVIVALTIVLAILIHVEASSWGSHKFLLSKGKKKEANTKKIFLKPKTKFSLHKLPSLRIKPTVSGKPSAGSSSSASGTNNGACFKHFAPGKGFQVFAGTEHFRVASCQDCSAADMLPVNLFQQGSSDSKIHNICMDQGTSNFKICNMWQSSECKVISGAISCPSTCKCAFEQKSYTHTDSQGRVIDYEVKCDAKTGYQYNIDRSNSHNNVKDVRVESNFLPNVAVVDVPSVGKDKNNIGGRRRRRLLQGTTDT